MVVNGVFFFSGFSIWIVCLIFQRSCMQWPILDLSAIDRDSCMLKNVYLINLKILFLFPFQISCVFIGGLAFRCNLVCLKNLLLLSSCIFGNFGLYFHYLIWLMVSILSVEWLCLKMDVVRERMLFLILLRLRQMFLCYSLSCFFISYHMQGE